MWDLRCLFKAPPSANFWPQNSHGFFASSSCSFSSSVRVPSLILCLRTCLFKPSPWMKPSPHWSHLSKFNHIQQLFYKSPEGSFTSVYLHMLVQYLLPHKTLPTKTACERFCVAVHKNSVNGQLVNIGKSFQTRLQHFGSNKRWASFHYPALEGVDTLMNLLFMVQSFGLLFESLNASYTLFNCPRFSFWNDLINQCKSKEPTALQ